MDWLATQLNLLKDGLIKKEQALTEIVNITENQNTVLQSGLRDAEARAFIAAMNRGKQGFITQVIQCDNMFEAVLKEAGPRLDACPDSYRPQVEDLQKRIRRVMDLDVKVRVMEGKNSELSGGKTTPQQAANAAASKFASGSPPVTPTASQPAASPKQPILQPDAGRVIGAYVKNTRNYKG